MSAVSKARPDSQDRRAHRASRDNADRRDPRDLLAGPGSEACVDPLDRWEKPDHAATRASEVSCLNVLQAF